VAEKHWASRVDDIQREKTNWEKIKLIYLFLDALEHILWIFNNFCLLFVHKLGFYQNEKSFAAHQKNPCYELFNELIKSVP
jgi:hypothetical protein